MKHINLKAIFISLLIFLVIKQLDAAPCDAPANKIVEENCLPGNPPSEWDIVGAGDSSIQGFATAISVNHGENISFKINTVASNFRIDIYRLGYYNGDGARLITSIEPTLIESQPPCLEDSDTGLIDCGNWSVSASFSVPSNATSGIYIAKLVREDVMGNLASHIAFIVRDDERNADLLFQTSDTTWQAYNRYGGNSLYVGAPVGRAYKVSYNRPFITRENTTEDWLFNSEYPMVRFLERNGYDVSYASGVDSDRFGSAIINHKIFLSVGHDEYWSQSQRAHVTAARDAGVHLAFFSGNEIFWKTRYEPSISVDATPYRTLVTYKETHANAKIDPSSEWTGTWRDNRPFNPQGSNPENSLSGTIFMVNCCSDQIRVPAADGKMRFWRDTSVADLLSHEIAILAPETLGYEWDEDLDNGFRPAGLVRLSSTTLNAAEKLLDQGSTYGPAVATHRMTFYRDTNGTGADALVFSAGTIQWPWGLDSTHDRGSAPADIRMQQATVNLFADMNVQPATLQQDLLVALASTDITPPSSSIVFPINGDEVSGSVLIFGSAIDTSGVVGGVEISVDNGVTWHPADGRENFSYNWIPDSLGEKTILSRAVDDSGNLSQPGTAITVNVVPATCPCSIWDHEATPSTGNENIAVELGVKFRSNTDGFITALRFFKVADNNDVHTGRLWTESGVVLAQINFTNETASGWQEAILDNPVAITANTTYVASYHSSLGVYAYTHDYFLNQGFANPPLEALQDSVSGANGIYKYGPPGGLFSNGGPDSFRSSNYWVDVVFATEVGPDTTPPIITEVKPQNNQVNVPTNIQIKATFNEAMDEASINGLTFELRNALQELIPAIVSYDDQTKTAWLIPLEWLTTSSLYTAKIRGQSGGVTDLAQNPLAEDKIWTFTTSHSPPPEQGMGGPILIATTESDLFSKYYAEILRTEGLNEFLTQNINLITEETLNQYDVVILAPMALSSPQLTMFSDWVMNGGNLIVMRPTASLGELAGLSLSSGSLDDGYLKIDNLHPAGAGLTSEIIQFHNAADRWELNGAIEIAKLYMDSSTPSLFPAVTLISVGNAGGQVAAFTYDLARSIVYTRQGNPAWAGQERDGQSGPIRPNDLFYGNAQSDPKPDWVNLDKVHIPQADEQQRLLANLIILMNRDKKPLPRFWYLPKFHKAAVILTGDDHGNGGTSGQFETFALENPGCSVDDWECIRATSYIYVNTPLSDVQAKAFEDLGFEISLHVNTNCNNWSSEQELNGFYSSQLLNFASKYSSLDIVDTTRTHCVAWSDWASQPKVNLLYGIRLNTNYYYWPGNWVQNRPGMFTGSGMPMRFADLDGSIIDVYQATTQMTDESDQIYPFTIDELLDKAQGPQGYYGVFTANMHTDGSSHPSALAIINSAKNHNVPVVSSRQMLNWLDGKNAANFIEINFNNGLLHFNVVAPVNNVSNLAFKPEHLSVLLPTNSAEGVLVSLTRDDQPIEINPQTIKGIEYAVFDGLVGCYRATYTHWYEDDDDWTHDDDAPPDDDWTGDDDYSDDDYQDDDYVPMDDDNVPRDDDEDISSDDDDGQKLWLTRNMAGFIVPILFPSIVPPIPVEPIVASLEANNQTGSPNPDQSADKAPPPDKIEPFRRENKINKSETASSGCSINLDHDAFRNHLWIFALALFVLRRQKIKINSKI